MFNLQECHQNTRNCKFYFTVRKKPLKTCQERPDLACGRFIKVFYERLLSGWSS